jgi:hypothetical protein
MTHATATAVIPVGGGAFDIGQQHGSAVSASLREFLDDGLCRLNRLLPKPVTLADLSPTIAAHGAQISAVAPALGEEIRGLAEGAGISHEEALLLQLRREIIGYNRIPTRGDCTTYARTGAAAAGVPVLAQTVDLNGNLDDHLAVLDVTPEHQPRRCLVLSFGGLLGYLGLNSDGLAIGLNLVLAGQWRPGLPPYLAIRHLLDTCGSVSEALTALNGLRLASSRSIMLCDREKTAYVEIVEDDLRVVEAEATAHTNHYLHPDFVPRDEINVFSRNSSVLRLRTAEEGLSQLSPAADAETHFELLSTPPICIPDDGEIRRDRTVAAVVMFPTRGELHLRRGDPSLTETQVIRLT